MRLIREHEGFKRLTGLDASVDVENQQYGLSQLVHDLFDARATRRRPLNWSVLRDFLYYAYGVRQERSRINRSICELVGQSAGEPAVFPYGKMVCAGYTATPFANLLNEDPTNDPLCPDCIKPLATNSRYFGLQRIFGGEGESCNMNIVRPIADDEYQAWVQPMQEDPANILVNNLPTIQRVHNFAEEGAPEDDRNIEWISLERAVKWAFCTAAARRVVRLAGAHNADDAGRKYRWTTMLFNLSHLSNQETGVHVVQQKLIESYIRHNLTVERRDDFVKECMAVWAEETVDFIGEDFAAACGGYGDYQDYPATESVREALRDWFIGHGGKVQVIQMNSATGDLDQPDYNDPTCQDGDVLWIVCGGTAISRGLTLEGLTVSYYDRIKRSSAIDTITQMGRWFGYRPGYELLPRIWMTSETIREMKQICRVEESLHAELQDLFEVQEDVGNGHLRYPSIRERLGFNLLTMRRTMA